MLKPGGIKINFVDRRCPLCGSAQYKIAFSDINRREGLPITGILVECDECKMHYLNPIPNGQSLVQIYRNGWADPVTIDPRQVQSVPRIPTGIPLLCSIVRLFNGLLRGHPHDWPEESGRGRKILDFGCLDGSKLISWYQRGWQVAGIDLNLKAIEVAKRRFPDGQFWYGDLMELDISERFDFVRADNVIEHLIDPKEYLLRLVKLLKPGGYLRVYVPNGAALSTRLFGRYSAVYWMPFHINFFTKQTLMQILNKAGLSNVVCNTFNPIGSWSWTQRQLLLKPGFNKGHRSRLDKIIRRLSILNYPLETVTQWFSMGEEVIGTGQVCFEHTERN